MRSAYFLRLKTLSLAKPFQSESHDCSLPLEKDLRQMHLIIVDS